MAPIWIYTIFAFACLILITIITGLEYSWLNSNKLTIELKKKQGRNSGLTLSSFFDEPESFWRTTAVLFYCLTIIFCFLITRITEEVISHSNNIMAAWMKEYEYAHMILDVIICIAVLLLFIGVAGKKIFERNPENKLNTWSLFIDLNRSFLNPIALGLVGFSESILKYLFNVRINKKETIFERINPQQFERQSIQGHEDLEDMNKELFQRALRLTQVKVRSCFTPRNEVTAMDIKTSIKDLKEKFIETKLSKIVIYNETLDNIDGYVYHLDLNKRPNTILEILHPIPAIPETMSALDVLRLFSKERKSIAWVVDEFGGTAGFVSIDDVLEEVFGNIKDEYDIEEFTENQISDNEYLFSGRLKLSYLNEKYDFDFPTDEAETLSGYIIANYEVIPRQKERLVIGNYEFEILLVTETKIETVRMKVLRR